MCNCRKGATPTATATKYLVTYPNGGTETKTSEIGAKLAAGRVPGATWKAQPAQ